MPALHLTFDVEHDVLAAALADPVGGLAHVGAGLGLGDALQHEAEVGEDHAALGGVGQLHALHREQLSVGYEATSAIELQTSHRQSPRSPSRGLLHDDGSFAALVFNS